MNVLVTGINGFIGASYAARLRASGDTRIFGIDLQPSPSSPACCDEYMQLDLGASGARAVLIALPAFDRVLHAGGVSGFMVETDNPQRIFDVNVAGTMALLDTARRTRCGRVVLCSTIMVYGPASAPEREQTETEYPEPISVYGASKLAIEALMHAFAAQYGVDALALRFSHVYGPGRTTECFVREMLAAASERRPCRIPQASGSLRQYVHISDVVESIVLAMRATSPRSHVFNISADEMHTLAEVADVVRKTTGALDVTFDESHDLPNYRVGSLSIRRAREELGYAPRLPLAAGIADYWKTFTTTARSPQRCG
ncbi:MAG TPA: NAD(P)-dependent oxidoreductase [Casimicrobiaceae bacterium]|nr:NAD(P)-dependent oxidoreductase [Casimicrobiaceae bacterium]